MASQTKGSNGSLIRTLRYAFDTWMPIIGVMVILSAVLFVDEIRVQVAIVIIGILLVEAGVWKLSQLLLPNERQFVGLRAEGDHFIMLIRHLNASALALKAHDNQDNQQAVDNVRDAMHQSVDRMVTVAGQTEEEACDRSEVAV